MATQQEKKPDAAETLPPDAPDGLKDAARGKKVEGKAESDALGFLLGATKALPFTVEAQLDTEQGDKTIVFKCNQVSGDRILKLEDANRDGDGPFAPLDNLTFNAQLVTEACQAIVDKESGESVDPKSPEFRGTEPDPSFAMKARFQFQHGILDAVAAEIRRMAGEAPNRVGRAQRTSVDAVGNSSSAGD